LLSGERIGDLKNFPFKPLSFLFLGFGAVGGFFCG